MSRGSGRGEVAARASERGARASWRSASVGLAWALAAGLLWSTPARAREPAAARAPAARAPAASQGGGASPVQPGTDTTQIARDLFERGKARWAAGQFEEAAALLAASNRQLPKAGTSLLLADAYEQLGRLRTARDTFRLASQLARESGETQLEYRANTREAALLPRLPQVEIRVPTPLPAGLSVTLDGRELPASELNVATALDAGTYLLEARAPGREPFSARLEISNAAPQQIGVRVVSVQLAPRDSGATGRETLAWWLGGAGGVLAVASVVTLVVALDANSRSNDECGLDAGALVDDENACTAQGVELRNQARTLANLAAIGGVLGVAGIGAGLTLHFTAPSGEGSAAWVGYGAAF